MASDGDTPVGTSRIRKLIIKMENMLKHPKLNEDLSQALDEFIRELSVNNHFLRNGIFTMKFAEIGIFLQSSVDLYSKHVDMLWEDTLQYHVKLCSYNQASPQNELEAEKITERINRNKRKKIVRQIVQSSVLSEDLLDDLEKSSKVLHICESITNSDALKSVWKEANKSRYGDTRTIPNESRKPTAPLTSFNFSTHQNVQSIDGEKLGNYHNLFINHVTPYLGSLDEVIESESTVDQYDKDFLLQRYLKHKGLTYKEFCLNKLEEDFNFFKKKIQQIDALLPVEALRVGISNASMERITAFPEELLSEHTNDSDDHLRSIIHDLLVKERQGFASRIKKSSERMSEVDSAFQDEIFNDTESGPNTPLYTSQRSNVDSGIFDTDLQDQNPITSSDPSFIGCVSESNVSNTINATTEGIFEENINADDIPHDDSTNIVNEDTLEPTVNEDNMDCSVDQVVDLPPIPMENATTNATANRSPVPVHVTVLTNLKPLQEEQPRRRTQKRKTVNVFDDDEIPLVKPKRPRFKWLKTTTTTLKKFEKFFQQHYMAEDDEVNPDMEMLFFEDDSDDEVDNVCIADTTDHLLENEPEQVTEVVLPQDTLIGDVTSETEVPVYSISIIEPTSDTEVEQSSNVLSAQNQVISVSALEVETSNRMKAIKEWRSFIEPKLNRLETNSEFDIHEYGSRIMDAIPEGESLLFNEMVSGKKSSDVCKLFLASLQLANTNNIEIISAEHGKLANDCLQFKLLTRERYHEHLNDYEAPSENTFRERLERVKASYPGQLIHSTPKILNKSKKSRSRLRL